MKRKEFCECSCEYIEAKESDIDFYLQAHTKRRKRKYTTDPKDLKGGGVGFDLYAGKSMHRKWTDEEDLKFDTLLEDDAFLSKLPLNTWVLYKIETKGWVYEGARFRKRCDVPKNVCGYRYTPAGKESRDFKTQKELADYVKSMKGTPELLNDLPCCVTALTPYDGESRVGVYEYVTEFSKKAVHSGASSLIGTKVFSYWAFIKRG